MYKSGNRDGRKTLKKTHRYQMYNPRDSLLKLE